MTRADPVITPNPPNPERPLSAQDAAAAAPIAPLLAGPGLDVDGPLLGGGPRRIMGLFDLRVSPPRTLPLEAAETDAAAAAALARLTAPRPPVAGLSMDRPRVMGVLNVTPDSFSDGGLHLDPDVAAAAALEMASAGADIIDVGGESTRPGAKPPSIDEELRRVLPVIEAVKRAGCAAPISIDTRRAVVAEAAFAAGARILNDVSGLAHDPAMPALAARLCAGPDAGWAVLMHMRGDPSSMKLLATYEDVAREVFVELRARVATALEAGAPADRLIVDPGIGFAKTARQNLKILQMLPLFHSFGAPVLLGASRKSFIGKITGGRFVQSRVPGSLAAALSGRAAGAHILRVHDVGDTAAALQVWRAIDDPSAAAEVPD